MRRRRDLLLPNVIALPVLLLVLLAGWREAAAFGLAVLVLMNLLVLIREWGTRSEDPTGFSKPVGSSRWDGPQEAEISYEQARAAYEGGHKLHLGGRIYLVRPALREPEAGLVLWVTDERTLGEHGLLLFPDGRVEVK